MRVNSYFFKLAYLPTLSLPKLRMRGFDERDINGCGAVDGTKTDKGN
jgi:hypothetical protein